MRACETQRTAHLMMPMTPAAMVMALPTCNVVPMNAVYEKLKEWELWGEVSRSATGFVESAEKVSDVDWVYGCKQNGHILFVLLSTSAKASMEDFIREGRGRAMMRRDRTQDRERAVRLRVHPHLVAPLFALRCLFRDLYWFRRSSAKSCFTGTGRRTASCRWPLSSIGLDSLLSP